MEITPEKFRICISAKELSLTGTDGVLFLTAFDHTAYKTSSEDFYSLSMTAEELKDFYNYILDSVRYYAKEENAVKLSATIDLRNSFEPFEAAMGYND